MQKLISVSFGALLHFTSRCFKAQQHEVKNIIYLEHKCTHLQRICCQKKKRWGKMSSKHCQLLSQRNSTNKLSTMRWKLMNLFIRIVCTFCWTFLVLLLLSPFYIHFSSCLRPLTDNHEQKSLTLRSVELCFHVFISKSLAPRVETDLKYNLTVQETSVIIVTLTILDFLIHVVSSFQLVLQQFSQRSSSKEKSLRFVILYQISLIRLDVPAWHKESDSWHMKLFFIVVVLLDQDTRLNFNKF